MARRSIVITSINAPTRAVEQFARVAGWDVVVVGDRKTPADWALTDVTFLTADDARVADFRIHSLLPYDHYSRKMLGYLFVMRSGAEVIVDTDDDNAPLPHWGWPDFSDTFATTPRDLGFINIYRSFTDQMIWPRGLPLRLITDASAVVEPSSLRREHADVAVWQGLADGDPDVDAIYRLTNDTPCYFDDRPPVVLDAGTHAPFNSQNTAFRDDVYALLYLPAFVTFRFTDILRGLVAQSVLHVTGMRLGFTRATVVQERNPHDYTRDFESEIPCYLKVDEVMEICARVVDAEQSVSGNLVSCYDALADAGIVGDREPELVRAWADDVSSATRADP